MSIEQEWRTAEESPNPWRVEQIFVDVNGVRVRLTPEGDMHATEVVHAVQARKMAMEVLRSLGFTQRLEDIELILGEFTTNCIEHGDEIKEVDIDYDPDVLQIQTVNGVLVDTVLPSEERRGKLATDSADDEAEDGRGLMLTEMLADEWRQSIEGDRVVTYARFGHIHRSNDTPLPPSQAA